VACHYGRPPFVNIRSFTGDFTMALKFGNLDELRQSLEILRETIVTLLDERNSKTLAIYAEAITNTVEQKIINSPAFAKLTGGDRNEIGGKCRIILLGVIAIQARIMKGKPSMN
jgi:hypothetical protein